jgi:hypothetical protein
MKLANETYPFEKDILVVNILVGNSKRKNSLFNKMETERNNARICTKTDILIK